MKGRWLECREQKEGDRDNGVWERVGEEDKFDGLVDIHIQDMRVKPCQDNQNLYDTA